MNSSMRQSGGLSPARAGPGRTFIFSPRGENGVKSRHSDHVVASSISLAATFYAYGKKVTVRSFRCSSFPKRGTRKSPVRLQARSRRLYCATTPFRFRACGAGAQIPPPNIGLVGEQQTVRFIKKHPLLFGGCFFASVPILSRMILETQLDFLKVALRKQHRN